MKHATHPSATAMTAPSLFHPIFWLLLAGGLLFGTPVFGQGLTFSGKKVDYTHPDLDQSFRTYDVYQLDVDALARAAADQDYLHFSLELADAHRWNIRLSYHDLRGPDYQEIAMTERGYQVLPARRAITYRGYLDVKTENEVRLNLRPGYLTALIQQEDDRLFLETLSNLIDDAPAGYVLLYRPEDFIPEGTLECSVSDIARHRAPIDRGSEKAMAGCQTVEFLTAATFDMVNRYGTVAAVNDRIQCITNLMEPFYHFAMVDFVIVQQFAPANAAADPFTASADGCDLLNSLQAWAAGGGIATHDLGQLWTARDIFRCGDPTGTSLIGRAMSIGNVCDADRYNICEDFTPGLGCLSILSAHEIGHCFGGVHGDAGTPPASIMAPTIDCSATSFSGANQTNINNHIASRACLANCGTPGNNACPNALVLGCGDKFSSSTENASASDAPGGCTAGGTPNAGVWFRFFGTGDIVTVSTQNSSFDTQINLYSGACGSLTCLDGDDDSGPGLTSELTFCSLPGVSYYVYLDGFGGATGFYSINIGCTPDITAPTVACPGNQHGSFDKDCSFTLPDYRPLATATDNCDPAPTLTQSPAPGATVFGSTFVTVTATDNDGNSAFCQFYLTVTDETDPTINCPPDFIQPTDPGLCTATFSLPPALAEDNCDVVSLQGRFRPVNEANIPTGPWSAYADAPGGTFDPGRYQVQWRALDGVFNSAACSYYFTVVDAEPPTVACFDTTIVFNGEEGIPMNPGLVWDEANSSDNCGGLTFLAAAPDTIFCDELGDTVTVTVIVADGAGNRSFCAATVNVVGLPCGWRFDEDGIDCAEGNSVDYDLDEELFTLQATHCFVDKDNHSDQAGYLAHELCGDGELIARVDSVFGQGWAGLSMRESDAPGAKKVELTILNEEEEGGSSPGIGNNNIVRYEVRTETDSAAQVHHFPRPSATWLRLVREGDEFYAYTSHNGTNWYPIWVETVVEMAPCIEVGLLAFSYATSETIIAQFSEVTVIEGEAASFTAPEMQSVSTPPNGIQTRTTSVFPNPAADRLRVVLNDDGFTGDPEAVTEFQLFDAYGRLARRTRMVGTTPGTQELDVSALTPGTYYLRILLDGQPVGYHKVSIVR